MINETYINALFVTAAVGVLAVQVAWATRRVRVRISAVLLLLYALAFVYLTVDSALGNPKDATLERVKAENAAVLAARIKENVAVYMLLQLPGIDEPRYYRFPWDKKMAEELQKMMEKQREGKEFMMRLPFEKSWDKQESRFYDLPQPKMPEKMLDEPEREVKQWRT